MSGTGAESFICSPEQRSGLLVAVLSGRRPQLAERPTRKLLGALKDFGAADVVWVVRESDAAGYEQDEHAMVVYSDDWCEEYAAAHWLKPGPPPEQYPRLFCGREVASLEAEKRGCWGVLQLDDNIVKLVVARNVLSGIEAARINGGMALFADLLAAVTLSTNGRFVGAALTSIPSSKMVVARAGFPYSLFIEQVGKGREHYYGPIEEDIIQAYQYGNRADVSDSTALLVPSIRYCKEYTSKGGMRAFYDGTRAVPLARMFPETAKVTIKRAHSNGQGGPRVFHHMSAGAIRNPMIVHDRELFGRAKRRVEQLLIEWRALSVKYNQAKIDKRVKA
jgi:hypothetical protein